MYGIAKLPDEEREILFRNAAAQIGMNAAIIEKRFLGLPYTGLSVSQMPMEEGLCVQRRHEPV